MKKILSLFVMTSLALSCVPISEPEETQLQKKVNEYAEFTLTTDISSLSENQKKMIPLLIEVAEIMDQLFWKEAFGDKNALLDTLSDEAAKTFVRYNYGPWDRLRGNEPFIDGVGEKPAGAQHYPADMTKEEFEAFESEDKTSLYTFVRRNEEGQLYTLPYHEAFAAEVQRAADLLKQAAELAEDEGFKKYLNLRAEALLSDDYLASDLAWMDMKNNRIDFVVGPIENYEDQLYNYKTAHEAYVLVKDMAWSEKLAKYVSFLPELQANLPVEDKYKQETPGTDSDLNAYDVIYYAGDCNSGGKTIAINLPNDERVQLEKGTRRLQLKNAMQAKFDKIMVLISELLIDESQRKHVTFDAFFANTMFHEVAHGLGIKNTLDGKGTVRDALKETGSALEEGKADILGLYMVTQLHKKGEIEGELMDYYSTFLAGIFRSVRFGASSAHGKANMIRFNYFKEMNAFSYDAKKGTYKVNFDEFQAAMNSLSEKILTLQGDGDYAGVTQLFEQKGLVGADLQKDLDRVGEAGIPRDIVFKQGVEVLGL
ncbi:dipeptidyl-peptidase 3 family protein [Jiulongibacter sediminis]|uniref:Zn-dependent hydrolase n=1 Tax=Jiulongibacter sediminis TaxID=1605367 RepID=A0A0P7C195_9BACT|nr:Zn-dependent hydrolase [Jiulongibacter sediminis]KPM48397.1 Zn-dependent hydrolase [Jiulongibacter sediminis]TBX24937.1 Zn-dependent hydrolase [Jiulongibacter sediminis]